MKAIIPWNRFTKHLCVFVFLALICAGFFVSRFSLIPVVLLTIPLVHRIERDYRSTRQKCPRCRRWKPRDEFDLTLCTACFEQQRSEDRRVIELSHPHTHRYPMPIGRPIDTSLPKPAEPTISVSSPDFAIRR